MARTAQDEQEVRVECTRRLPEEEEGVISNIRVSSLCLVKSYRTWGQSGHRGPPAWDGDNLRKVRRSEVMVMAVMVMVVTALGRLSYVTLRFGPSTLGSIQDAGSSLRVT